MCFCSCVGIVARGIDLKTNDSVAVKVFKSSVYGYNKKRDENLKEAEMINSVDHENVISLIEVIEDEWGIVLIFPLMSRTLHEEINAENFECTPQRARAVAIMLMSAIEHMAQRKILHRDLKPNNILVDANGNIKICDFGLATKYSENEYFMQICGTYNYMAPEMLLRFGYGNKVDIWVC